MGERPQLTVPFSETTKTAWLARPDVTQYWSNEIDKHQYTKVAEFGPGGVNRRFPRANILVDHFESEIKDVPVGITTHLVDIDLDRLPVEDNAFDFVYCRHLMEDLNNPVGAFREMTRLSKRGYIETPSPLIESLEIDYISLGKGMTGYPHHRFLFWTYTPTNTLYAIQKFPAINIVSRSELQLAQWVRISQELPHFFNNYYQWDMNAGLMPKIVMLKHGVNYDIDYPDTYGEAINRGTQFSVDHTQHFFDNYIKPRV
eukprot:GDKK01010097.1.p1 GENE.GDKK01010097.1~~GDKK01010097.1.p1  ORF type:complete len:258 (+),score=12.71 GDKK01010097.1:15-788(+)